MLSYRDFYAPGELPPLGHVPRRMLAHVIRRERFGQPERAFALEQVDTPRDLRPTEVLVYVMAAGINYNNVWAASGAPLDVISRRADDPWFPDASGLHVGGSDASGIVWAVGSAVTELRPGMHVVLHCGQWHPDDPALQSVRDPLFAPSFRTWGYETNWGSFGQFARVQAHQCLPKPAALSWEQAASYMLVGATAYRMLTGFEPNVVQRGDVVLVWGGAGGLGTMAIQITRELGGVPVAVVSDTEKGELCMRLGAQGFIDRREFSHWGAPPSWRDQDAYGRWLVEARRFGAAIWQAVGSRKSPSIVFEHPGEATIATSMFVCDAGGMVVTCAGTSGYAATVDLRYLWMRQKRLQGSHFANDRQASAFNELVQRGVIDVCLSTTYRFEELPRAHQLMFENRHPHGNLACLINAPAANMGRT